MDIFKIRDKVRSYYEGNIIDGHVVLEASIVVCDLGDKPSIISLYSINMEFIKHVILEDFLRNQI